jgi:hypothetical protein
MSTGGVNYIRGKRNPKEIPGAVQLHVSLVIATISQPCA